MSRDSEPGAGPGPGGGRSDDDPVGSWPIEALQAAVGRGDSPQWRPIMAEIEADPWGPVARIVEELVARSEPGSAGEILLGAVRRARDATAASERAEVAREIKELLRGSGLLLSEFASRAGTSASRMSTYANGRVTPSAAMLLRIRRVAARQQVQPGNSGGATE